MLAVTFTVLPTNATASASETYAAYAGGAATFLEDYTRISTYSSGSTAAGRSGIRSTTAFVSEKSEAAESRTDEDAPGTVYTESGGGSGATTFSWNGAFTQNGIVGSPQFGEIAIQTTTTASHVFFGTTIATTSRSTLSATEEGGAISTTSTSTQVETTIISELTHTRRTTTETTEEGIVAYTASDTDDNFYIAHPQPEYGTRYYPEVNEVLWLLTAQADGVLTAVANSYTDSVEVYPAKEFFAAGVYDSNHAQDYYDESKTMTFYGSLVYDVSKTIRSYVGVLPAEQTQRLFPAISATQETVTFVAGTASGGNSQSSTSTSITTVQQNAADSAWTTVETTTTTTRQWESTFFVTGSDSASSSDAVEDQFGTGSESGSWEIGNSAAGEWSRPTPFFYKVGRMSPREVGRTFANGWFALSQATSAASALSVAGLTLSIPTTLRANQLVLGVWPTSWAYTSNSTSVTASAWGAGVSVSSIEPGSSASITTTSGAWVQNGNALTAYTSKALRAFDGGLQKTGTATLLAGRGSYYTFDSAGNTGVQVLNGNSTFSDFKGIFQADNYLRGGAVRIVAEQRNFTALPA